VWNICISEMFYLHKMKCVFNHIRLCVIAVVFLCHSAFSQGEKNFDTIYVSNPNRNVKITFDKYDDPPVVDIGTKDFGARVLGCCDVILKAAIVGGKPTSLYIRYGDRYYNGTIAYKENLSIEDEVLDFRNRKDLPAPINENRAITVESPSLDRQFADRRIGVLEGKSKDRFSNIAIMDEKIIFKVADLMQDDLYLYVKLGVINESKQNYSIKNVDFLFASKDNEREYKQVQPEEKLDNGVRLIEAKTTRYLVYAFPKFTTTAKWVLEITMTEAQGGRKLVLKVPYDKLNDATKF
jgi:hypothetical protein